MSLRRDYTDFLRDILEYAEKAERFVRGTDFETFQTDEEKTLAVVRALEVIGEAARHVPATVRRQYPRIPWEEMVGMRSKLIHDYFGVDLKVVWRTVHEDLPPLRITVKDALDDLTTT